MAIYEHGIVTPPDNPQTIFIDWYKITFENFPNTYYLLYIDWDKYQNATVIGQIENNVLPHICSQIKLLSISTPIDAAKVDKLVFDELNSYGSIQVIQTVQKPIPRCTSATLPVTTRFKLDITGGTFYKDKKLKRIPTTYNPQIVPDDTMVLSKRCCVIS